MIEYANKENPYYEPETWGLEIVALIDYDENSSGFDYRVVWRFKRTDKLYTARNSGCSCPSPFEDYHTMEDLDELTSMVALREEIRQEIDKGHLTYRQEEAQRFLGRVSHALRKSKI